MRSTYIALAIVAALLVVVVIYAFVQSGLPSDARAQKFDNLRVSSLSTLSYQVDSYYSKSGNLPATLQDVPDSAYGQNIKKDPETGVAFDYATSSQASFKLCAVFSTDSSQTDINNGIVGSGMGANKHKKGYDCLSYDVPAYYIKSQSQTVPALPPPAQPSAVYGGQYYGLLTSVYVPATAGSARHAHLSWATDYSQVDALDVERTPDQVHFNVIDHIATSSKSYDDFKISTGPQCYQLGWTMADKTGGASNNTCVIVPAK